jgi:hypothetical protein
MHLHASAVECVNPWLNCTVHDDGSVRDTTYRAGTIPIYPEFDGDTPVLSAGMSPDRRYGLEIVVNPYAYAEFLDKMYKFQLYFDHVPQTPRTSIHIHVDVAGESWKYIRNVLLWAYALEAPIFRMACDGGTHRGERIFNGEPNDHRYARPLSDPIGIESNGRLVPLIDWTQLVEAETASEFVAAWGRFDIFWNPGIAHYCPHRLHMINLASVQRQGTLEWRVFDGIYGKIAYFAQLVYAIHDIASKGEPDFAPMLLGSQPNIDAVWLSRLLNIDCEMLWGTQWPRPVRTHALRSHYPDAPRIPSTAEHPVNSIRVIRTNDNGSDNFPLFRRT